MEQAKILLVEDDANLGSLLKEYLIAKGFETELQEDGEKGYQAFLKYWSEHAHITQYLGLIK